MKESILFDRLANARTPDDGDKAVEKRFYDSPHVVAPYEHCIVVVDGERGSSQIVEFGKIFFDRLRFSLECVPQDRELQSIVERLDTEEPQQLDEAVVDLKVYVSHHPELVESAPLLGIVAELPKGFGWYAAAAGHWRVDESYAKEQGLHVPRQRQSKRIGVTITHRVAQYLALGYLYTRDQLQKFHNGDNYDNKVAYDGVVSGPESLDVQKAIRLYQAAEKIYGDRWEEMAPDVYSEAMRYLAMLDWEQTSGKEVFQSDDDRTFFREKILPRKKLFGQVAGETQGVSLELSWPFFIKKLWEEDSLLEKQFCGLPELGDAYGDIDDMLQYLDDPRMVEGLRAMAKEAAATFAFARGEEVPEDEAMEIIREVLRVALTEQKKEPTVAQYEDSWKEWAAAAQKAFEAALPGITLPIQDVGTAKKDKKKESEPSTWKNFLSQEGRQPCIAALRKIQWEDSVRPFKQVLERAVASDRLVQDANQLTEGWFRDFFLSEAWKRESDHSREVAERYLERMQDRIPEGAEVNRAQDIMNRYVRDHVNYGTENDPLLVLGEYYRAQVSMVTAERAEEIRLELEVMTREDAEKKVEELRRSSSLLPNCGSVHRERKKALAEQWKDEKTVPGRFLYVFSDAVTRGEKGEGAFEKAYPMHVITEIAHTDLSEIRGALDKGRQSTEERARATKWITEHLPEKCMLRDFYLENHLNVALWDYLAGSRLAPQLAKEGVALRTVDVDLRKQFEENDDGVLQDAYFTEYTLFRLDGLVGSIDLLTTDERAELASIIREYSTQMTDTTAEGYERIAIELEAELMRREYETRYQDALPKLEHVSEQEDREARDKAFAHVFDRIAKLFPLASYNRDELLERFALDFATTPEQARKVEEATYDYLVRKPEIEQEKGEKVLFAPVEQVKNYLSLFRDRESRARILGWVFGGEVPDDRYLEGRTFGINANEEREAFWLMSGAERRAVLYNALLGKDGLFEVLTNWRVAGGIDQPDVDQKEFYNFLEVFYKHNFEEMLSSEEGKRDMEPVLRTAFFETFKHYSPPRRVELFAAITERMREVRLKGKKLNAGQTMRLFLEQVGVVGIKAGQVISEQKGLVSDDIKHELSSLQDNAAPFSKFGVFTYLRAAELLGAEEGDTRAPFRISQVGQCLGSASIKQSHYATTVDGKEVVVKVPRPSIDKNYEEDIVVLEKVLKKLREEGVEVPEFLLPEIVDACASEFDFGQEGMAQREVDACFYGRRAQIGLESLGAEGSGTANMVKLDAPDLVFMLRKGESKVQNLQLLVDEYVRGFSLKEVEEWQRLTRTAPEDAKGEKRLDELKEKLGRMYHERAELVGGEYTQLSVESLRAQIALDFIEQVVRDGVFHADEHAGNIMIDLDPKSRRVAEIDFGSTGRSVVRTPEAIDHRPKFREFLQHLFFLKMGIANTERLGVLVDEYVEREGMDAGKWAERIERLHAEHVDLDSFFKELLADILSEKGKMNRQFKMLLKGLAASGGHFDALRGYASRLIPVVLARASTEEKPPVEILRTYPGFSKMEPLLAGLGGRFLEAVEE